jgi:choloylglycine hydrolase
MKFLLLDKSFLFKVIFPLFLLFSINTYSCTDFLLMNNNKNVVVGRSMEFGMPLSSQIVIFPRNEKWLSKLENNEEGLSWTSRYAYISVTSFDLTLVTDGMNEQGLSLGTLWFETASYPDVTNTKKSQTINMLDFGNWILGSFSNVKEVKQAMNDISIWFHKISQLNNTIPPVHFSIHDTSGKSLVIEFINEKMNVSDNEIGVLTNTPEFSWHKTNLSNYINLTAIDKTQGKLDGTILDATGAGAGLLGIPGDWTPPSRFVKIAIFKNFIKPAKTPKENKNLAFHLLNSVDIPLGAIRNKDKQATDHTQWVVVKDLTNKTFSYRTYKNLNIKTIKLLNEIKKIGSARKKIQMKGAF